MTFCFLLSIRIKEKLLLQSFTTRYWNSCDWMEPSNSRRFKTRICPTVTRGLKPWTFRWNRVLASQARKPAMHIWPGENVHSLQGHSQGVGPGACPPPQSKCLALLRTKRNNFRIFRLNFQLRYVWNVLF